MAHEIILPLSAGWEVEQEVVKEQGEDVVSYYAQYVGSADENLEGASIELYVGNTPEGSNAEQECMASYVEAFDAANEKELPIGDIRLCGKDGFYYDAEDEKGAPVIVICFEYVPGTLVMAILAAADEEKLDGLLSFVDESLKID